MVVQGSLALTGVLAALTYLLFSKVETLGLLLGAVAGILGFWVPARRLEKFASASEGRVYSLPFWWRVLEFALYILVLTRAYYLDRVTLRGFLAAVVGLFIVRLVTVVVGLTGLDLKQKDK